MLGKKDEKRPGQKDRDLILWQWIWIQLPDLPQCLLVTLEGIAEALNRDHKYSNASPMKILISLSF